MGSLTEEQLLAVEYARQGHSFLLTGQAGSGKSFLLQHIFHILTADKKIVNVTATTGIAAANFPHNMRGMTIHRWAGLGDGRHEIAYLCHLIDTDEKLELAKLRIKSCDILILDEVSMLSRLTFERLEAVCRKIRRSDIVFGGLQVIFAGDFRQLPPVKSVLIGDDGAFPFESEHWNSALPHHVSLKTIFRQNEPELIDAVNELSRGELSMQTIDLMGHLARPFPTYQLAKDSIKLFALNDDVDLFNALALTKEIGQPQSYKAVDKGDRKMVKRHTPAPEVLHLKVHAPVILLRNLSDQLVNGCLGRVISLTEEGPVIHFHKPNMTVKMDRYLFTVYDGSKGHDVGSRFQFPLKLAFALTVHKSQGMSLDAVQVDCRRMHNPGQIGVAIGRAKTLNGLRVVNFHPQLCIPQPDKVGHFYELPINVPVPPEFNCCGTVSVEETDIIASQTIHDSNVDSHFEPDPTCHTSESNDDDANDITDEEMMDIVMHEVDTEQLHQAEQPQYEQMTISDALSSKQLKERLQMTDPTPIQQEMNDTLKFITDENMNTFVRERYLHCNKLYKEHLSSASLSSKETSSFYRAINAYMQSQQYKNDTSMLFGTSHSPTSSQFRVAYLIMTTIRQTVITEYAINIKAPVSETGSKSATLSSAVRGKIRYVGGWAVAKLNYHYKQMLRNSIKTGNVAVMMESSTKVQLLEELKISEHELMQNTNDPESLQVTAEKQNIRRGLTNITDRAQDFFTSLLNKTVSMETDNVFHEHGSGMFKYITETVINDMILYEGWSRLFALHANPLRPMPMSSVAENLNTDVLECLGNIVNSASAVNELFSAVVQKFTNVIHAQFRKEYLGRIKRSKAAALRKELQCHSKTKGTPTISQTDSPGSSNAGEVTFASICSDCTHSKQESHNMLQAILRNNPKYLSSKSFKRDELFQLCAAYDLKTAVRDTKAQLSGKLCQAILNVDNIPKPDLLSATDYCGGCKKKYKTNDPWIMCDSCEIWFCRRCAKLEADTDWVLYDNTDNIWKCTTCNKV